MKNLFLKVGRRGAVLLFFALLDFVYAYGLLTPTAETLRNSTYMFIGRFGTVQLWAALWAIAGVFCLVNAFRQKDSAGFTAAIAIKILWGLLFLMGWLIGAVDRGYLATTIWLGFAALLFLILSWPEPNPKIDIAKQ